MCSPWADVSQSSPSWRADHARATAFDYLPAAPDPSSDSDLFFRRLPSCAAWPPREVLPSVGPDREPQRAVSSSDDGKGQGRGQAAGAGGGDASFSLPRASIYAPCDPLLAHPLVSPALASDWTGAPPIWIACGWERIADELRFLGAKMARDIDGQLCPPAPSSSSSSRKGRSRRRGRADGAGDGGTEPPAIVRLEQYEAMPHAFNLVMRRTGGAAWTCNERWAAFVAACVEAPETLREGARLLPAEGANGAADATAETDADGSDDGSTGKTKGSTTSELITFRARTLEQVAVPLREASDVDEPTFHRRVQARIGELSRGRRRIEEERRKAAAKL